MATSVVITAASSHGKDLPSAFLPRSLVAEPVLVDTLETIVESKGQKFRQIEYRGDKYLVSYVERDQTHDDEPICIREVAEETPKTPETYSSIGDPREARHRESFVQGLKVRCQKMTPVSPFEMGLKLKADENAEQASAGASIGPAPTSTTNAGTSTRDRMKKEISQDDKPAFGAPGNKGAGISF